jgi:hypothetical protein
VRARITRRLAYPVAAAATSLASPCGRQLHAGPGMAAAAPRRAESAASHVAARVHVRRAAPCLLIAPSLSVALALRRSTYLPALFMPSGYLPRRDTTLLFAHGRALAHPTQAFMALSEH